MIKEEIEGILKKGGRKANETNKLKTALAWIGCLQKGRSPIDRLREEEIERIIVYGITELGKFLVEEARQKEYRILAITDRAVREGGYEYQGIPVIRRNDIVKHKEELIVVTSVTFWEEIRDELRAEGCRRVISLRELL